MIEVPLNSTQPILSIRAAAKALDGRALVGAGTVLKDDDVDAVAAAGGTFIVSPDCNDEVIARTRDRGLQSFPGVFSPTEAFRAIRAGAHGLKFFPAEASGGTGWLKSVAAPLPDIKFCPTGGIDGKNIATYLGCPNVLAVGGSWVAPKDAIAAGDFARITRLAREASALRAAA